MTAKPLLDSLRGGDRRSIGRANAVAAEAAADPRKLAVLVEGLMDADPVVRMRAADALEKATAAVPTRLDPHKQHLIALAAEARQQELRWHLAQMLPRLSLTLAERGRATAILRGYLDDRSAIVKTCALQGLADLAATDTALRAELTRLLRHYAKAGTPAMRARCRKLLARSYT